MSATKSRQHLTTRGRKVETLLCHCEHSIHDHVFEAQGGKPSGVNCLLCGTTCMVADRGRPDPRERC